MGELSIVEIAATVGAAIIFKLADTFIKRSSSSPNGEVDKILAAELKDCRDTVEELEGVNAILKQKLDSKHKR